MIGYVIRYVLSLKRRRRLELAADPVIRRSTESGSVYRYVDPETGTVYAGRGRFDPFLVASPLSDYRQELGSNA